MSGRNRILFLVSAAMNVALVVAILSVRMEPASGVQPANTGEQVERLTALDGASFGPGTSFGSTFVAADMGLSTSPPFIMIGNQRHDLGTIRLPWLMAQEAQGNRGTNLGPNCEINDRLAYSLSLTVSEKAAIEEFVGWQIAEMKAIEKAGARLSNDDDGSTYYVVEPDAGAKDRLRSRMREGLVEILGESRGLQFWGLLGKHEFFKERDPRVELAVERGGGIFDHEFVVTRKSSSGESRRERRVMDKFGIGGIERRWGHVFETEAWKEYVEATDPGRDKELYVPKSSRKTGSVLLDGFPKGDSLFR